jgi:hypothetical protein
MLIAGEHPIRQPVILVEFGHHLQRTLRSIRPRPETCDHTGPVLIACPLLTPCVASARSFKPFASSQLDELRRDALGVFEIRILRLPVVALLVQQRARSSRYAEPVRL